MVVIMRGVNVVVEVVHFLGVDDDFGGEEIGELDVSEAYDGEREEDGEGDETKDLPVLP